MNENPRFWIDTRGPADPDTVVGWFAVVDEERGGIVAYFGREEDANVYIHDREAPAPRHESPPASSSASRPSSLEERLAIHAADDALRDYIERLTDDASYCTSSEEATTLGEKAANADEIRVALKKLL